MRNRWPVAAGAAVLLVAAVLGGPRALAVPAGLLLAFVLPGTAAVAALVPRGDRTDAAGGPSRVERLMLVPALSLALLVLGGLALNACGVPLNRWSWTALTMGATGILGAVAYRRRHRGAPRDGLAWRRAARHLMPLALAAALLGGAAWISLASAHAQASGTPVTALAVTTTDPATTGTRAVVVSVTGTGRYQLRVTGPDGYSATRDVTAAGSWRTTLRVPAAERVTAQLYRSGDATAYRTVYLDGASALAGT